MRALLIAAGLFFSICGALLIYLAASGAGHEYDLKLVLPIDARQMPTPVAPPEVVSQAADAEPSNVAKDGRAEAGQLPAMPDRPLVRFEARSGSASEAPLQE